MQTFFNTLICLFSLCRLYYASWYPHKHLNISSAYKYGDSKNAPLGFGLWTKPCGATNYSKVYENCVQNFYLLVSFTAYTVCKANHLYLFRSLEHTTTKTTSSALQRDVYNANFLCYFPKKKKKAPWFSVFPDQGTTFVSAVFKRFCFQYSKFYIHTLVAVNRTYKKSFSIRLA